MHFQKVTKGRFETRDEKEALEYYNMMKAGRKRKAEDEEEEEEGESGDEMGADDNEEEIVGDENMEAADGKRGITYQVRRLSYHWQQFHMNDLNI